MAHSSYGFEKKPGRQISILAAQGNHEASAHSITTNLQPNVSLQSATNAKQRPLLWYGDKCDTKCFSHQSLTETKYLVFTKLLIGIN